jgi:hypothetical protein
MSPVDRLSGMSLKEWLHGLLSAVINGVAGSITVVIVDPTDFNIFEGREKLVMVAIAMALVGAALYLKDKPLPDRLN